MSDARRRHELEHGVEHPEAGAQHRHDDDVGSRSAGALRGGASGVSTVTSRRQSRIASAASSTLIRVAAAAECVRRPVVLSRSVTSASCTSGWSDDVNAARRPTIQRWPEGSGIRG